MSAPAQSTCRALRELWAWLSGTGYRPERHYMRGGIGRAAPLKRVAGGQSAL
jgi:hypothetical protein